MDVPLCEPDQVGVNDVHDREAINCTRDRKTVNDVASVFTAPAVESINVLRTAMEAESCGAFCNRQSGPPDKEAPRSMETKQETMAQSHGSAGPSGTPEMETAAEKNPWSAWAWLGLCKKRGRKTPHMVYVRVDSFFASVEQALNPTLRGKPVVVGRGVVESASYEALSCGVRAGMNLCDAVGLCPKGVVLRGNYAKYAEFSERVGRILNTYANTVEAGALDDFCLDFVGTNLSSAEFAGTLRRMQAEILERTGLRVAIGAARTHGLASIACGLEAPCGLRVVAPGAEEAFLALLPVEKLPGFKPEDAALFAARGIKIFGHLRNVPKPALRDAFGKTLGEQLWRLHRGLEACAATATASPASVSREKSIEGGTLDSEVLRGLLGYLHARVALTLREHEKQAHTIGVRIEYADSFVACETVRLTSATCDGPQMLAAAEDLIRKLLTRRVAVQRIRLNVETVDSTPQQKDAAPAPARAWRAFRANPAAVSSLRWNAAS